MGRAPLQSHFPIRDDRRETKALVEESRRAIRESLRLLRAAPDRFVGDIAPEKRTRAAAAIVTPFQLYIIERSDAVRRVEVFCEDDATALRAALSVAEDGRIEVWRGGQLIQSWETSQDALPN